jgi:hypothetical protein
MPACSTAPLIAAAPSWVADNEDNEPLKLPIGVLTAETMTTSCMIWENFGCKTSKKEA